MRPPLIPTLLDEPVVVEGHGAWLVTADGRRYLDCVAGPGVLSLGHDHPRVIEALQRQARRLIHSSFQLNEPVLALAEKLVGLAGEKFQRVLFANSGSEAVEAAVKLAKKYQASRGRYGHAIVALENGYHGRSGISLALTGLSIFKRGLPGFSLYPGIVHIPVPSEDEAHYDALARSLDARLQGGLVAVIVEPLQGVGGIIVPPDGFLRWLRDLCDEHDALLIFDEILTGLGRTGPMFAFQQSGVVPDILLIGKALGGGLPVGAVLTTEAIGTSWLPMEHSTTFGGNVALVGAVGCAVVDELLEGGWPQRVEAAGEELRKMLAAAASGESVEVRGKGFLIGLDFAGLDRSSERAAAYQRALLDRGVLTGVGGQGRSVVRLTPPLNLDDDELALLREAAVDALAHMA